MSRKHFVEFAKAIACISDTEERKRVARIVADVCAGMNSRFNYNTFFRRLRCGGIVTWNIDSPAPIVAKISFTSILMIVVERATLPSMRTASRKRFVTNVVQSATAST